MIYEACALYSVSHIKVELSLINVLRNSMLPSYAVNILQNLLPLRITRTITTLPFDTYNDRVTLSEHLGSTKARDGRFK